MNIDIIKRNDEIFRKLKADTEESKREWNKLRRRIYLTLSMCASALIVEVVLISIYLFN